MSCSRTIMALAAAASIFATCSAFVGTSAGLAADPVKIRLIASDAGFRWWPCWHGCSDTQGVPWKRGPFILRTRALEELPSGPLAHCCLEVDNWRAFEP
jgi:hypothetical protein